MGLSDRERLVKVETELVALDRLLRSERETNEKAVGKAVQSIEQQLGSIIESAARLAERSQVERAEERIRQIDEALADVRTTLVPRGEFQLRLETVLGRQETMSNTLNSLAQLLTALRAELAGRDDGEQSVADRADRNRSRIYGAIGAVLATAAIIVTIYLHSDQKVQIVPAPTPTTTTVTASPAGQ